MDTINQDRKEEHFRKDFYSDRDWYGRPNQICCPYMNYYSYMNQPQGVNSGHFGHGGGYYCNYLPNYYNGGKDDPLPFIPPVPTPAPPSYYPWYPWYLYHSKFY